MKKILDKVHVTVGFKDFKNGQPLHIEIAPSSFGTEVDAETITKERVEQVLKKIRPKEGFHIYDFVIKFQYVNKPEIPPGFNTCASLNLPYHLPLPQGLFVRSDALLDGTMLAVHFRKIWTEKAEASDEIEAVAEEVLYYDGGEFKTPNIPQERNLGHSMDFTGKNIEKDKDREGYFRYTQLLVCWNTTYSESQLDKKLDKILSAMRSRALEVVNRIVDIYRSVTREEFVDRLGYLAITQFYFADLNIGYHSSYGANFGIRSAVINRKRAEIERIVDMIEHGEVPPIHDSLMLDASSSMLKRNYDVAVLQSFQALEVFVEHFLLQRFGAKALTPAQAQAKLTDQNGWNLKARLTTLLEEATGLNLNKQSFWSAWCTLYDQVRNEIIHRAKKATESQAKKVLELNAQIIALIRSA